MSRHMIGSSCNVVVAHRPEEQLFATVVERSTAKLADEIASLTEQQRALEEALASKKAALDAARVLQKEAATAVALFQTKHAPSLWASIWAPNESLSADGPPSPSVDQMTSGLISGLPPFVGCSKVATKLMQGQRKSQNQRSIVHGIPVSVKNTFIHVKKPFSEDPAARLPARSASEPSLRSSSLSTVASVEAPSSAASPIEGMQSTSGNGVPDSCTRTPGNERTLEMASVQRAFTVFQDDVDGEPDVITCNTLQPHGFQGGSVSAAGGMPSAGAALHSIGECKPCAWFWRPSSCHRGEECSHCHLCPEGEIYRRRKERKTVFKAQKALRGA